MVIADNFLIKRFLTLMNRRKTLLEIEYLEFLKKLQLHTPHMLQKLRGR
jgi:hypothetical protein